MEWPWVTFSSGILWLPRVPPPCHAISIMPSRSLSLYLRSPPMDLRLHSLRRAVKDVSSRRVASRNGNGYGAWHHRTTANDQRAATTATCNSACCSLIRAERMGGVPAAIRVNAALYLCNETIDAAANTSCALARPHSGARANAAAATLRIFCKLRRMPTLYDQRA